MQTKWNRLIYAGVFAGAITLTAVAQDAGVEAVREAQNTPAPVAKSANAFKVLQAQAKAKNWREGWDDQKKREIVIEAADFKTADPATDASFFIKREMAVKKAVLSAKVSIIQSINQDMSASDQLDMPGTDIDKKLGAERDKLDAELAAQKENLAKLLGNVNASEAAALRGTTTRDRLNSALDAAIKKLDKEYDASANDAKKQADLKAARERYEAAQKQYKELQEKAEAAKGELLERQTSTVESMAKMPLYGASVIMQTESWDKNSGIYQVAVMLCWSHAMERAARAIVTGETGFKIEPSGNAKSVNEWLDEQNLAVMSGPRQYVDKDGTRWFLGISARPYGDNISSTERRKNKGVSEMFAQQMALFCVFADVESYKMAKSVVESRGDATAQRDEAMESYAEKLTQSFKNKKVRGLQKLAGGEAVHPITGETIYVSVYGLNPEAVAAALENEKINYATKVMDNQYQTVERGRDAANAAAVEASKNRKEDYDKGFNQQSGAINSELDSRQPKPAEPKGGVNILQEAAPSQNQPPKKSTGGVFGGDKNLNDDF